MIAKVLSIYVLTLLLFSLQPSAECAQSTAPTTAPNIKTILAADAESAAPSAQQTDALADLRTADWAFVLRDASSATHLRMDTITRTLDARGTVLCGDIKKVYTKHGLLHIYYSLKNSRESDAESLAILKEIDYSVSRVSYLNDGASLFHRLHRVTFYNKNDEPLETLDFEDIARQTDTDIEWQEVTRQMTEERAIFYRLANG